MLRPDGRASARKSFVLLVVGMVVFFLCSVASADVPDSINYQGKLTTASGGCLNDTVQMTFTIYADAFGNTTEWTEIQTQVEVKEGIFNVLLGSVNPLAASIFDGSAKYLGVQVESDPEMRPLKPMVSVAYAFRSVESDTAQFAVSAAPDDDWDVDTAGLNVYRLTGGVGIGTPSPQEKLDVDGNIHASGTIASGSSITIDGASDKITATSGTIDFDDENLTTNGTAEVGGFRMAPGIAGYILTSDADGVGTWQEAPGGNGGGHTGAIYRWTSWSTFSQTHYWMMGNDSLLFGGVKPNVWGDAEGTAGDMSTNMEVLRTLFTRKGYGGKNAVVVADEWKSYSSTNSRHTAALFRIRNTTGGDIVWTPKFWYTCYRSWGEKASVALNGTGIWDSGTTNVMDSTSVALTIPGNQTSTVIVVSGSASPTSEMRTNVLAFFDNCLELPAGLEYVDDLDTAE